MSTPHFSTFDLIFLQFLPHISEGNFLTSIGIFLFFLDFLINLENKVENRLKQCFSNSIIQEYYKKSARYL